MLDAIETILQFDELKLALPLSVLGFMLIQRSGRRGSGLAMMVTAATAASVLAGGSTWIILAVGLGAASGFFQSSFHTVAVSLLAGLTLALTEAPARTDFLLLYGIGTALIAWTLDRFSDLYPKWTNLCVSITCAGLFLALPNPALAGGLLLSCSILIASGTSQPNRWSRGAFGPLFVYAATRGGISQIGSIVGGLGTIGLIAILPIAIFANLPARWLRPQSELDPRVLLVGHALVTAMAARIAAFRRPSEEALVVLVLIVVVGVVIVSDGFASLSRPTDPTRNGA